LKKLTIGSLKYSQTINNSVIHQSITIDKPLVKETKRMLTVEQDQAHFQVQVKKGQSILDAALEQNVSLDYKCKKGTCGKCKVKVLSGRMDLQPANTLEEKKLAHLLQTGFRLACQAKVK
jgi:ferredoxin, 2Fe-2S